MGLQAKKSLKSRRFGLKIYIKVLSTYSIFICITESIATLSQEFRYEFLGSILLSTIIHRFKKIHNDGVID